MKTLGLTLFFGSFVFYLWVEQKIKDPKISGSYRFKDLPAFKMCADPEDGLQVYCHHIAHYNFLKGIVTGLAASGFLILFFSFA